MLPVNFAVHRTVPNQAWYLGMSEFRHILLPLSLLFLSTLCVAQRSDTPSARPLDQARALKPVLHEPLPEQYIWTAGEVTALRPDHAAFPWSRQDLRLQPLVFRKRFHLAQIPSVATIYLAGPRQASVFLNGQRLARFSSDIDAPIGLQVFHADASKLLQRGENTIAVAAVRGRGIVSADASLATTQLAYGEVLVVKMSAAGPNRKGVTLLVSDSTWRSQLVPDALSINRTPKWAAANFNDMTWPVVSSLGPIEEDVDLRQWSADAGMYAWPGYQGTSKLLGVYALSPAAITHVFAGQANLSNVKNLLATGGAAPFVIDTPPRDYVAA